LTEFIGKRKTFFSEHSVVVIHSVLSISVLPNCFVDKIMFRGHSRFFIN